MNFCSMYVLCPFPLSETILCHFVAFLVSSGLSYQSVRVYLSALRHYQLLHGGVDPCFSSLFRLHYVLRGVRRSLPTRVRPCRLPITPSILRTLYHHWSQSPVSFNVTCLWAACCLGFFGFLRSGEFTCQSWSAYDPSMLSVGDVEVDSRHSPSALHVSLRHSKTDVFGVGATIHLGRGLSYLCPVAAVLAYLAVRPSTPGPLFVLESGVPLSRQFLVTSVRVALSRHGLDVNRFNGHSFRIGAATTAAQAGLSDSSIQLLGRWKSSVFVRYLRPPVERLASVSSQLANSL